MDKKGLTLQVPKWYALRTYPKRERIVGERLKLEGAEIFIPLSNIKREWSDRVKSLETPLLESIVLVHCNTIRLNYLSATKGVVGIISDEKGPVVVENESVEALKEFSILANGAFMTDKATIDKVIVVKWEKRGRAVMKVDDQYFYLYLPELDITLYIMR